MLELIRCRPNLEVLGRAPLIEPAPRYTIPTYQHRHNMATAVPLAISGTAYTPPEAAPVFTMARDWLAVVDAAASDDRDVLRFVAAWLAFSALYGVVSNKSQERERVHEFTSADHVRAFHEACLRDRPDYLAAAQRISDESIYNHWKRKEVPPGAVTDLSGLVYRILTIRGNLFHGHKSPVDKRDVTFVRDAFVIVNALVREFIDPARLFLKS